MNELEYLITRSARRKSLTITVERDRKVVVRAPEAMSDEEVQRYVDAKRHWILGKLCSPQKYEDRLHPPGKELVNGESAPYLGTEYRIEVGDTKSGKVEFSRLFKVPPTQRARRREVLREWYVERAIETILPRAERYARELGVEFKAAKIVDNRYRWGSCTAADNISFNWRLIKAPMFVVDYVIVHELAHLIEANHTDPFWNIVRAKTPTMDKAKAWLKEHGQMLEEEI
jgi:predicted metal-dependent hydrolase